MSELPVVLASQMQIERLVESIKAHRSAIDTEAYRLRTPEILASFDKRSHSAWCLCVAGDCLVRVRLLLEQNFNFIETMGVVAVARYLFELSVWLHLFELEDRYGLVYYGQLLETQRRYFEDYRAQLCREISLLRAFDKKEELARNDELRKLSGSSNAAIVSDRLKAAEKSIDVEAARHFSIFAEQAKVNGYGFQAHLVESKAIPQVDLSLTAIVSEQLDFDAHLPPDTRQLVPKRWQWRQMSEKVGLTDEYDFLYAFASKLLHATPASITTDQKNLEPDEFVIFLKYIEVKIMELVEHARRYPRVTDFVV